MPRIRTLELVSGGLTETIGTQDWVYPSEAECLLCHTSGAGGSLGLETRQLNSSITYPATGRSGNQLTTLQEIGLFANTLTIEAAYPDPADTAQPTDAEHARICTRTARSVIGLVVGHL